jgi:hypothetical protein
MGVGAASGRYSKRAEVDKTTGVTRAPAARVPALRAADAGKSAARPDVMCSAKRGGMQTSNVTTAFIGPLVRSHCAGRCPGGQREHCARKNKPSHHSLLRVLRAGPGDCSHKIEISVGAPRAMTIVPRGARPRASVPDGRPARSLPHAALRRRPGARRRYRTYLAPLANARTQCRQLCRFSPINEAARLVGILTPSHAELTRRLGIGHCGREPPAIAGKPASIVL